MPWYTIGRGRRTRIEQPASGDEVPVTLSPAQGFADPVPLPLPGWRRRTVGQPTSGQPAAAAPAQPSADTALAGAETFRPNRRAARYAPAEASFEQGERALPLLTVSMSGLSMRWDGSRLPAIGTTLNGDLRPEPLAEAFPAAVHIVRVEPERRLAAGRFIGLDRIAMDRLLDWLIRLDREAADAARAQPQ